MNKIALVTEKPFSKLAVSSMQAIAAEAGFVLVLLEKYTDPKEVLLAVSDVEALIVRSDIVSEAVIKAAPKLKIVVRAGAGYDNLDLDACTANNVVAMNTPGQNSNAVAELVFGLMICMARNGFGIGTGTELKGKKIGLQAYGNIGRLVAALAKGFGMEVYAFDPFVDAAAISKDGVKVVSNLEELYAQCDYVSLHIPATAQTKESINYALLSKMPKGATLINTARKEVIQEADLLKIMTERSDFHYATDIAPSNHEQLKAFAPRYFATPKKIGAETAEANVNAGLAAVKQIVNFFASGDKKFSLNIK